MTITSHEHSKVGGSDKVTHVDNPPGRCHICDGGGYEQSKLIGFSSRNQPLPCVSKLLDDQETRHSLQSNEQWS